MPLAEMANALLVRCSGLRHREEMRCGPPEVAATSGDPPYLTDTFGVKLILIRPQSS